MTSCKLLNNQVTGIYIDSTYGDTLKIISNKTYEYIEKLNTGYLGWTYGNWNIKNRKIQFKSDRKPLVNYKLKIGIDSSINNFQIKLLLNDTEKPINIEDVFIYKNNISLSIDNFKKKNNAVQIFAASFDSIVLKTSYFKNILFVNNLNTSYGYIVRVFPAERLYQLDKVPFKIKKYALKSTRTKEYSEISHVFTKLIQ